MKKRSPQTVPGVTLLQRAPSSFSLQLATEEQLADAWWGGPRLPQGSSQVGTGNPSPLMADSREPVSLPL